MDVTKAMIDQFGDDDVDKTNVQEGPARADRLRALHVQVCGR